MGWAKDVSPQNKAITHHDGRIPLDDHPIALFDAVRPGAPADGYADARATAALAIAENRPHRASGALAYHVLDVMKAFQDSSESNQHVPISSGVERPAPIDPLLVS
jgi:hypothetical protein